MIIIMLPQAHNTRFIDRVYIPHKATRDFLRKYSTKGLSAEEYSCLKQLLECVAPEMLRLFNSSTVQPIPPASTFLCKDSLRNAIKSLAASSPVCGLLHPSQEADTLVQDMCNKDITKHAQCLVSMQQQIPVFLKAVREDGTSYDQMKYGPVMTKLLQKCYAPYGAVELESSTHGTSMKAGVDDNEPLVYFPHLKKCRCRGNYIADGKLKEPVCTKHSSKHPTLLPGIFTLFCEHGICYGFQVLQVCESPNVPFTVLLERTEEAPKHIIYDNSCNLHSYCLNREPEFFKKSWFLVDRFHWANHTGCSSGYNMRLYPQFESINSQIVEQSN